MAGEISFALTIMSPLVHSYQTYGFLLAERELELPIELKFLH